MSKVTMPEPFGWLLDCLPGGGLAFQRERPSEMQSLVNSTCAVFTTSQAEAYAAAKVREALEEYELTLRNGLRGLIEFDRQSVDVAITDTSRAIRSLIPPTE